MAPWIQRFTRLWRHRWTESKVAAAFPAEALQRLEAAVRASEALHTGQVRISIEGGLPYSYLWRGDSARTRAVGLFGKLRVWDTEHNNGVLIYLLMAEHAIEIVADRAVARAVPPQTWQALVQDMERSFAQEDFAPGLLHALETTSQLLAAHFPRGSGMSEVQDTQGLPDAPVVQGRFRKSW